MPISLSIKNVPDELADRLRERAKLHHRSLQGELLAILEESLKPKGFPAREILRQVQELGLKTNDDSTAIIRELRDTRYSS